MDNHSITESSHHPIILFIVTALTAACLHGKKKLVQLLLSRGAMLSQPNEKGFTPLLCAVKAGYWDIAVVLLREGADIECTDSHGRSALMIAAAEGHVGLVEMLLTNSKFIKEICCIQTVNLSDWLDSINFCVTGTYFIISTSRCVCNAIRSGRVDSTELGVSQRSHAHSAVLAGQRVRVGPRGQNRQDSFRLGQFSWRR